MKGEHKYSPSRWAMDQMHYSCPDKIDGGVLIRDGDWSARFRLDTRDFYEPLYFEVYKNDTILYSGYQQTSTVNDENGRLEVWEHDGTPVHLRIALETGEFWRIAMCQFDTYDDFYKDVVKAEKIVKKLINKFVTV